MLTVLMRWICCAGLLAGSLAKAAEVSSERMLCSAGSTYLRCGDGLGTALYDRWREWAIFGARLYEILASFVRRLYECERFGASFSSCPPSKYAAPSKYCKLLGGVVSGALSPGTLPSNPFSSRLLENLLFWTSPGNFTTREKSFWVCAMLV